jgi:hypothetical protein
LRALEGDRAGDCSTEVRGPARWVPRCNSNHTRLGGDRGTTNRGDAGSNSTGVAIAPTRSRPGVPGQPAARPGRARAAEGQLREVSRVSGKARPRVQDLLGQRLRSPCGRVFRGAPVSQLNRGSAARPEQRRSASRSGARRSNPRCRRSGTALTVPEHAAVGFVPGAGIMARARSGLRHLPGPELGASSAAARRPPRTEPASSRGS